MSILIEKQDAIAIITIARPEKLNALTLQMYEDLGQAFQQCMQDADIKAVVLTGSGGKSFCVGADLTESIPALAEGKFNISQWDPAHLKQHNFTKPIVSAINGMCIGGGFEMILATDIRIASQDAIFQLPEVVHGFVPAGGTLVRLVRQIAYAHAMEIMLSGKRYSAEEMLIRGVVNEIVPQTEVFTRAVSLAKQLASYSTNAVQTIKEAVLTLQDKSFEDAFAKEALLGQRTFMSDESKTSLHKFVQKKPT